MRGLKQRTTPIDEFVATCSICGAALRPVHVLRGTTGTRCSFCGSPLMSAGPGVGPRRPPTAEDESPLGLLTEFERPRRGRSRLLLTISVIVLVAIAAAAFVRERSQDGELARPPDRPGSTSPAPAGERPSAAPRHRYTRVRVGVEVIALTSLLVMADDEVVEEGEFGAGERLTFTGDEEVTLRFYDGGVRLHAGGREVGTGGGGGVIEIRLWLDDGRIRVERTSVT